MKQRILICGDRHWADKDMIRAALIAFGVENILCVIEGEQQGADILAREAAEELHITVLRFPANWTKYGKAAGPIRNKEMLIAGAPTLVWAFHDFNQASRGTANMIHQAKLSDLPCQMFSHNDSE